jgi:hypothetical protein
VSTLALSQRCTAAVVAFDGQTAFIADFPALPVGGPYVGLYIQSIRAGVVSILELGTDWNVTLPGPSGFTAVLDVGAQAGDQVIVFGAIPPARARAYTAGGAVFSEQLEGDGTGFQAQLQEHARDITRAPLAPLGATGGVLPTPVANKFLGYDAQRNLIVRDSTGAPGDKGDQGIQGNPGGQGVPGNDGGPGSPGASFVTVPNASGTLAGRTAHDGEAQGYAYLATDQLPLPLLYIHGVGAGVWSTGVPFGQTGHFPVTGVASAPAGLTYTGGCSGSVLALLAGMTFSFAPDVAAAGACTLNLTPVGGAALGAKNIHDNTGVAITLGMLPAGQVQQLEYDGASFKVITTAKTQSISTLNVLSQANIQHAGVTGAIVSVSALGELVLSSTTGAGVVELARFDNATGNFRVQNNVVFGATAGTAQAFFSPVNLQSYVTTHADAYAIAQQISTGTALPEFIDDVAAYALNSTAPYYLNAGDKFRPIYVTAVGAFVDASFTPQGGTLEISIAPGTASVGVFCGLPSITGSPPSSAAPKWRGFSSSQLTLNVAANAAGGVVRVHCYSATDYFLEAVPRSDGTMPTISGSASAAPARGVHVAVAGQSLGVHLVTGGGLAGLQAGFVTLGLAAPWVTQGAVGSSALIHGNQAGGQPSNYWWDIGGATPGPNATNLISMINAAVAAGQPAPAVLVWNQGQQEVSAISAGGATTYTTYIAAMGALFTWIRAQLADATLPIVIIPLGSQDTLNPTTDLQCTAVREAQMKYIAGDAHAFQGPETYDLSRVWGNIHPNYAGDAATGLRLAGIIDNILNAHTNDLGPHIVGFSQLSTTSFKVLVNPGASSTSLNEATSGIQGFGLCSNTDAMNATFATITNVTRFFNGGTGNHEFTITTAAAAGGYRPVYPFGAGQQLNRTGRIIQNAIGQLPLRSYTGP